MASDAELAAMRQAIMLSALGLGGTSPNPPVGCVVLSSEGNVVGTGFHRRKGEAHAEVHALTAAGSSARGGTAVVTLEPCNHVGVTPACRQALLDAGIRRVVIGMLDPTSRGAGGAAVLDAAGIDVETGVLADEVLTVLRPWLTATTRGRPHVAWAFTVDSADVQPDDDALLEFLRSTVDVIVSEERVEEGVPGSHSARHFRLADVPPIAEQSDTWLAAAHQAGARTILLVGHSKVAAALSAADAIDSLYIAAPRTVSLDPTSLVSPSFEIVDVASWQNGLLIRTRRPRKV